jgi:dolichyl-phosphate beta-glucosyltransferase
LLALLRHSLGQWWVQGSILLVIRSLCFEQRNVNFMKPYLSIVIPAYNEEFRIARTLTRAIHFLWEKPYASEIIVVDDGSRDGTLRVIEEISRTLHTSQMTIRTISLKKNRGRGFAVRMGMISAEGSRTLLMDADASVPIEMLDLYMEEMDQSGVDMLIGSLAHASSIEHENTEHSLLRKIMRRLSWLFLRTVFNFPVRDTQRPFKLFTRQAVHGIFYRCTLERWGIDIEIIAIADALGFSIREMPIYWNNPAGSKVSARAYWQTLVEAIKVFRRQRTNAYRTQLLHYS